MDKPQKPANLMPRSFGGEKENFSEDKIATGYPPDVPDLLGGANLNYLLNSIGQELEYTEQVADFITGLPINHLITTDENNKLNYLNKNALVGLNYKNITNCILEAPSGGFKQNSDGYYFVPKGTRFLTANGTDINGNIQNLDVTLSEDVVLNTISPTAVDANCIFYLYSIDGINWVIGYRTYHCQWYEQADMADTEDFTWFNTKLHQWYNRRTADGDGTLTKCFCVPIATGEIKNGVITKIYKIFEPVELLTNSTRLSDCDAVDYDNPVSIPYNTVFTVPMDGRIYVKTNIGAGANYQKAVSGQDVAGYINPQFVTTSGTVQNTVKKSYTTVGTYTFNAPVAGYYKVILVGGGGVGGEATAYLSNGQAYVNGGGGGSGACFMGELYLTAGDHTVTVGGYNGATSIDGLIVAGGGTSGAGNTWIEANGYWGSSAGVGGVLSITGTVQNVTMQSNGNNGANFTGDTTATVHSAGGASLYNGWGAGAASNGLPATGVVYIQYEETVKTSETNVVGTLVYSNYVRCSWDGSSNTVTVRHTNVGLIPVEKGQTILFMSGITTGDVLEYDCKFYPNKREVTNL